uniref:Uncharacterized protein n=1 Tax=viral metagenome TaxID=1070528 RepID=A0A6C0BMW2_9ZZZZ
MGWIDGVTISDSIVSEFVGKIAMIIGLMYSSQANDRSTTTC